MTALTTQGMTTICLFVVQVLVGRTHEATQYSVNNQKYNMLNLIPSGHRNSQLLKAAHKRCGYFEKINLVFHCAIIL